MTMTDLIKTIRALEREAKALNKTTPTNDELADAIGDLRSIEVRLGNTRKRWESLTLEMDEIRDYDKSDRVDPKARAGTPVAAGERWEVKPTYTTQRTYNTQRIIADLTDSLEAMTGTEMSAGKLLLLLKERDALRFNWQWSNLKGMFRAFGVTLVTGEDELDDDAVDLEDPHVGELRRQTGVSRVPLKGK